MLIIPSTTIPHTEPTKCTQSEINREPSNRSIKQKISRPSSSISTNLGSISNIMSTLSEKTFRKPIFPLSTRKNYLQELIDGLDSNDIHFSHHTPRLLNGEEIAETLQAEASFTIATDKKPIVATYGCGPCVALGGYDPTNKIAFVVHFSNAGEVKEAGGMIFYNIAKLVKEKITSPIELHLRGGIEGQSENIIKAIKLWMNQREDLPMKIASEDILGSGRLSGGRSLSIDSRNGTVSEYDPMDNPKSREITDAVARFALISAFIPHISLAYTPE